MRERRANTLNNTEPQVSGIRHLSTAKLSIMTWRSTDIREEAILTAFGITGGRLNL